MIVFSYADPDSLDNIRHKWKDESEYNTANKNPPIILVGNKSDRQDEFGPCDRL